LNSPLESRPNTRSGSRAFDFGEQPIAFLEASEANFGSATRKSVSIPQ